MTYALTIVIPCYNEEARIVTSLATLDNWFNGTAEVLLIDDGSTDETFTRAHQFAVSRDNIRLHRLPKNGGKGAALKAAVPLATGSHVLFIDADLAFDRESVQRVLAALDAADVSIANRRDELSRYSVPVRLFGFLYRRHVIGLMFNLIVRALLQLEVRDTQCGLKGFRRDALLGICSCLAVDGFAIDIELLLVVRNLGLRLAQVPVQVHYESARSTVRILRSGTSMFGELMLIFVRRLAGLYSPRRLRAAAATTRPRQPDPHQRERTQ